MIVNSDCLSFLKTQESEIFDLVIADPPYFEIYGDFDFVFKNLDEYLDWCKSWILEIKRTLKNTGSFYLWGAIGYNKGYALPKLADWMETNKHFVVRNWITQKNCRGRGTKKGYMHAREELVFLTKSNTYTWNPAYTAERSNRNDLGANGKPRKNTFKRCSDVWTDIAEASQSKYQRFALSNGDKFPTVKALGLCERIIKASSNEGDSIYIPFGGSGSEAVAAEKLRRKWVLTEINASYIEEIVKPRISAISAEIDFTSGEN